MHEHAPHPFTGGVSSALARYYLTWPCRLPSCSHPILPTTSLVPAPHHTAPTPTVAGGDVIRDLTEYLIIAFIGIALVLEVVLRKLQHWVMERHPHVQTETRIRSDWVRHVMARNQIGSTPASTSRNVSYHSSSAPLSTI